MNINFFKNLYNEDIIYHYTKASTAIDYILYHNQLKFNNARKSNDPIESSKSERGTTYYGNGEQKTKDIIDTYELHSFTSDLEEKFHQICFCKNQMGESFSDENYHSQFEGNEEIFGFTKPRMWDQYADKYTGVCIALSKKKILALNKVKLDLIDDNVEYLTFQKLAIQKLGNIQGNHLENVGKKEYEKQIEKIIMHSFFLKHSDYSGENEYRIGTLYDKKKCTLEKVKNELVFDSTIMLDITECIKAIFVSNYANDRQKSNLLEYAKKMDVPIIEITWKNNSLETKDYREWVEFLEEIEENN